MPLACRPAAIWSVMGSSHFPYRPMMVQMRQCIEPVDKVQPQIKAQANLQSSNAKPLIQMTNISIVHRRRNQRDQPQVPWGMKDGVGMAVRQQPAKAFGLCWLLCCCLWWWWGRGAVWHWCHWLQPKLANHHIRGSGEPSANECLKLI